MSKHITKLFAVLMAAVIFSGCTAEGNTHTTMSELCIFRQRSDGTPIRTMLSSGITSTVCVDPLCTHETECPLNGMNSNGDMAGLAIGNRYCFVKGAIGTDVDTGTRNGECALCVYDIAEGTVYKIESYPDDILLMNSYDRYVYYTVASYTQENEVSIYSYTLYRADVRSRDIIEIPMSDTYSTENGMSTGDFPLIYAFEDDRIIWEAPSEDGFIFYTTDLAGKNRVEMDTPNNFVMNGQYHDGWAYYTQFNYDVSEIAKQGEIGRQRYLNERSLYRYHFETGKNELLSENIARYIVTDDGIFYTVMEETPTVTEWNETDYYDLFAGKLYRMNTDGSNSGLFCTLESMNISVYSSLFLGYTDGYLAMGYMDYMENKWYDSGYDYNIAPEIIIVDTSDGTWRISTDET